MTAIYERIAALRLHGEPPCKPAMDWLRARPEGEPPRETYEACPDGAHLMWVLRAAGVDIRSFGHVYAERSRRAAEAAAEAAAAGSGSQWAVWAKARAAKDAAAAKWSQDRAARAWVALAEARLAEASAWRAWAAARATAETAVWATELAAIADLVRAEWPWPRVAALLGVSP